MFSDTPLSATPLASGGGGPTWFVSVLEGVGGSDATSAASVLVGAVLVTGAAADTTSTRATFAGTAVDGVSGADTVATLQAFNIRALEAPAAADAARTTTTWLIQAVDGAAGVDYHTMRVVLEGAVIEDSVPTVLGNMTQLWEFIGTGVSAGWQAVPTGTPNAWTLIKIRND